MTTIDGDEMQKLLLGHHAHLEDAIKEGNFFRAESEAQMIVDLTKLWQAKLSNEE